MRLLKEKSYSKIIILKNG